MGIFGWSYPAACLLVITALTPITAQAYTYVSDAEFNQVYHQHWVDHAPSPTQSVDYVPPSASDCRKSEAFDNRWKSTMTAGDYEKEAKRLRRISILCQIPESASRVVERIKSYYPNPNYLVAMRAQWQNEAISLSRKLQYVGDDYQQSREEVVQLLNSAIKRQMRPRDSWEPLTLELPDNLAIR
jgi:hypothetical protein